MDPESSIVRISFEFYREKLGRFEEKLKHEGEVFRERVHLRFTTDPCFDNYSRSFSQWDRYNRSNANARWKSKKGVFELTMLHNFRTQFVKFNRLLNANLSFSMNNSMRWILVVCFIKFRWSMKLWRRKKILYINIPFLLLVYITSFCTISLLLKNKIINIIIRNWYFSFCVKTNV